MTNSKRVRSILISVAKFSVAVGILALMYKNDFIDLQALSRLARWDVLVPSMALFFVSLFINNFRWLLLMRAQGLESSIRETLPLSFIGLFFNYAMPGGVGGDIVKGYYLLQNHKDSKLLAATSIFIDRVVGVWGMTLSAVITILFNWSFVMEQPKLRPLAITISILFLGFCFVFGIAFSARVRTLSNLSGIIDRLPGTAYVRRIYDAVQAYADIKQIGIVLGLSLVSQFLSVMVFFVSVRALGVENVPLSLFFLVIPLGLIATVLPISPGGVGVGQAVFLFLFSKGLGMDPVIGPAAISGFQVIQIMWGLVGMYFYFTRSKPVMTDEVAR